MATVELEKVVFVETDAECKGTQDLAGRLEARPVERGHEGAELWQDGRRQPDVGLVRVVVGAYLIAFLQVTLGLYKDMSTGGTQSFKSDLAIRDLSQLLHHLLIILLT